MAKPARSPARGLVRKVPAPRSRPSGTNPRTGVTARRAAPGVPVRARLRGRGTAPPDRWPPTPILCSGPFCRTGCETARRESRICCHDRRLGRVPRAADTHGIAKLAAAVKNKKRTFSCPPRHDRIRCSHPILGTALLRVWLIKIVASVPPCRKGCRARGARLVYTLPCSAALKTLSNVPDHGNKVVKNTGL
jgi:hypothetical protein